MELKASYSPLRRKVDDRPAIFILTNSTLFPVQTNVYPSAVRRKMKCFDGFKRRAIVIVPADDEFQRRVAKREAEEGKDVPDHAVLEMKGGFV